MYFAKLVSYKEPQLEKKKKPKKQFVFLSEIHRSAVSQVLGCDPVCICQSFSKWRNGNLLVVSVVCE